ncbi:MAG TPA: hypothetical protein VHX59_12530 [Mycobacteriales bacterium]|nr:hypothetical protein [Mycobacteriales bacterium]
MVRRVVPVDRRAEESDRVDIDPHAGLSGAEEDLVDALVDQLGCLTGACG